MNTTHFKIIKPCHEAMTIRGTRAEWDEWTKCVDGTSFELELRKPIFRKTGNHE